MKLVFLALLMIPTAAFADNVANKPELARFAVDCVANSLTAAQATVAGQMQGTISVFNETQSGRLMLGSFGVFEFVADFRFNLNQKDDGIVTFSFLNADGLALSQRSLPLPKEGLVETSLYYFDTNSGVNAKVLCSVSPVAAN